MTDGIFQISDKCRIHAGMTVSRGTGLSPSHTATWFSLGAGTSISRESYDTAALYIGSLGHAVFLLGEAAKQTPLAPDALLWVPEHTLCGVETRDGCIYTEILSEKEITMNEIVKPGEAVSLKDLIPYEEGSITNLDIAHNDTMKFVLMAFDKGTGLQPHRAPGNAIVTALEGSAVIGYEGKDYPIQAGESFRFEKNGLHSVTADSRFKMSLLLVLE